MIKIVDNFLPEITFRSLQTTFLTNRSWAYCTGTVIKSTESDIGNFFFTCDLTTNPAIVNLLSQKIRKEFLPEFNIQVHKCNVNLTTFSPLTFQADAHIDYAHKHYVMVLYMNETDGNTIIYKDLWDESKPQIYSGLDRDNLLISQIVEPKENRCVFFDGWHYHSYFFPKEHNRRIIINMSVIVE